MNKPMLSFIKNHLPDEWDEVSNYTSSYVLFPLDRYSREYQNIEAYFTGTTVSRIQRVQNPFQYGRYLLRREQLNGNYESTGLHVVHKNDLTTALKFNCDYRRYVHFGNNRSLMENAISKQPEFYNSFSPLKRLLSPISDFVVLIVKKSVPDTQTQSDYFIQYIVHF